ncbi:hypothetical protein C6497_06855 [Candidatus Poribacteria bacterium]|nr:MAG: hypothetical protein C6497_06855 [Candidatus Poribacteria bacterium]
MVLEEDTILYFTTTHLLHITISTKTYTSFTHHYFYKKVYTPQAVCCVETDVADGESVKCMVGKTLEEFGQIDILVNNAGVFSYTRIDAVSEEEWDRMLAVNLKGPFLCSLAVMGTMKDQRFGRIINLGSLAGQVGGIVVSAPYSASKAGVMCLKKSFARVLGEYGITVNSIVPGIAATEMAKNHLDTTDDIPFGHVADPSDVANAILFLA